MHEDGFLVIFAAFVKRGDKNDVILDFAASF